MVISGKNTAVTVNASSFRIPVYTLKLVREGSLPSPHKRVRSAADVFSLIVLHLDGRDREVLGAILLDSQNQIRGITTITVGILDASLVHPREVFKPAILAGSAAIIIFHNHPSGDPTPSVADAEVTAKIAAAGLVIGIELLDHIVIGENRYMSFAEAGLLP